MRGVILLAYGSPRTAEDVEDYYTHIRGGRKPTHEQLSELQAKYRRIGGSPLIEITERQAERLANRLHALGSRTAVYAAMKHSHPFISEVIPRAKEEGVDELLCIVLAPHYSKISTGGYIKSVEEAVTSAGGFERVSFVKSWHDNPLLISAWARRIKEVPVKDGYWPVFTAHSLPERIILEGDPYRDQLLQTSRLVASAAGLKEWSFAFQSQSRTGEPWLGPDVIEHMEALSSEGKRGFLVIPVGFVSEHLEILYDLDVECADWAKGKGVSFTRCSMFNDSEDLAEVLESIVKAEGFF